MTRGGSRAAAAAHSAHNSVDAAEQAVTRAIGEFGSTTGIKLRADVGQEEDALRASFEVLLRSIGSALKIQVRAHGEARLAESSVRPDYAVEVDGAYVGYVELKAPGKGVPSSWSRGRDKRNLAQFDKLGLYPNVLYTDGISWELYRWGKSVAAAEFSGHPKKEGSRLRAIDSRFFALVQEFLFWKPMAPRTFPQMIRQVAGLCRLLRDEVLDTLVLEQRGDSPRLFTGHLQDWRGVLFPELVDAEFADAYAQTVTFSLLLARRAGVVFEGLDFPSIGERLVKRHMLMGRALSILTSSTGADSVEDRSVVVRTMRRVIGAIDWNLLDRSEDTQHWLYEIFLEQYDPAMRRRSGSYYTPQPLARSMVALVDEVLRTRLNRRLGVAADDVVVVDPAMGTGTFLLSILDKVVENVRDDGGDVPASLRELLQRLVGFEKQTAPYAVAELKLHEALAGYGVEVADEKVRFYVADTLDDPNAATFPDMMLYQPLAESRRQANQVKINEPVMVVVGNPPYRERARKSAGIMAATDLLRGFRGQGTGRHEFNLHNLNVYFWRWATWKVFEAHKDHPQGIVAFVTTSAYLAGPSFSGMRRYLREQADWGWVIDLSPEGHQPSVDSRLFPTVQQPICIGIFARRGAADKRVPARVRYLAVSGKQEQKMEKLSGVTLDDPQWLDCQSEWSVAFRPIPQDYWNAFVSIHDLMPWGSLGVMPNRTWVYAPEKSSLKERWRRFQSASDEEKPLLLKETCDRKIVGSAPARPGSGVTEPSVGRESEGEPCIQRIAHRSFDRQFLIADARVVDRIRPSLWAVASSHQIFVTTQQAHRVTNGPAVVLSAEVPNMDHYMGHHGGRAMPLYRDDGTDHPNIADGLVVYLERQLSRSVTADGVLAYIVGVVGHAGYTARFAAELAQPGVRVPLTRDYGLWSEAVQIGRQLIYLHTYGERCSETLVELVRPQVLEPIPPDLPDEIWHDAATSTLHVGSGRLGPVSTAVWEYQVSGMRVVKKWFGYRKREPAGRTSSPLDHIHERTWTRRRTEELRELLAVLRGCVSLESTQASLLARICSGPLISNDDLTSAGILPPLAGSRRPMGRSGGTLF